MYTSSSLESLPKTASFFTGLFAVFLFGMMSPYLQVGGKYYIRQLKVIFLNIWEQIIHVYIWERHATIIRLSISKKMDFQKN